MKKAHETERSTLTKERDRYKAEWENESQKTKLLQMEVKGLKSKLAVEGRNHEIEARRLREEMEGTML